MPATLEHLVTIRSQLAEELQHYYETLIETLDRTPWYRQGQIIKASDVAIPARVLKEETKPPPEKMVMEESRQKKFDHPSVDPVTAKYYEEPTREKRCEEVAWKEERNQVERAVIIGAPRGGKSFLTETTAVQLAQEALNQLQNQQTSLNSLTLPVHLDLSELAHKDLHPNLMEAVLELLTRKYDLSAQMKTWMQVKLPTHACWLILDALDQVEENNRSYLRDRLKALETRGWQSRVVLTCREANHDRAQIPWNSLMEYELAPFKHSEIQRFTRKWFGQENEQGRTLGQILQRNFSLSHACRNPLIATLSCLTYEEGGITEETRRSDLYAWVLRGLARRAWKKNPLHPGDPKIDDLLDLLKPMARKLFESKPESNLFTNSEIIDAIKAVPDLDYSAKELRSELLNRGILVGAGLSHDGQSQFSFLHRTFLEYLAACSLAQQIKDKGWKSIETSVDKKAWHPAWSEVIVLLAGKLTDPVPLLEMLSNLDPTPTNPHGDDLFRHRLALAALCLPELFSTFCDSLSELITEITTNVLSLWVEESWIKYKADDAVPHLTRVLSALGQINGRVRTSVITSVLKRGSKHMISDNQAVIPLLDCLVDWLHDGKSRLRLIALGIIERIGSTVVIPEILACLTDMLRDPDKGVSLTVTRTIYTLGSSAMPPEMLAHLTEMLYDPEGYVRGRAAEAIGIFGSLAPPEVLARLAEMLDDPEGYVRGRAAEAIGMFGSLAATPEMLARLTGMLRDPDKNVRGSVKIAFDSLGSLAATPDLLAHLTEMLHDPDEDVRFHTSWALDVLAISVATPEALAHLTEMLHDPEGEVRMIAAAAIGNLRCSSSLAETPEVLARLTEMLDDPEMEVRWSAAWAIGQFDSLAKTPEVLTRLIEMLDDPEGEVRMIAASAIDTLGSLAATPEILARLTEMLDDPEKEVRRVVIRAIMSFSSLAATPEVLVRLTEMLLDPEGDLRGSVAVAIGTLGSLAATPEILARLTEMLHDPAWNVRISAAEAIGMLGSLAATPEILARLTEMLRKDAGLGNEALTQLMAQGVRIFKKQDATYEGRTVEELSKIDH